MQESFLNTIEKFDTITLSEMDKVSLLDRTDTKFIFHRERLNSILKASKEFYNALVINKIKYSEYNTHYFDTQDLKFYYDHHNKRANRYKVRTRSYVNSNLHFFEIKKKSNQGRTIKNRIKIEAQTNIISTETSNFLRNTINIAPDGLQEKLELKHKRITLIDKYFKERVTIDFDLKYNINNKWYSYPNIVIAEVKQNKLRKSVFFNLMRKEHIHPMSLSKYCFGIANHTEGVKRNYFKKQILYINKISNQYAG